MANIKKNFLFQTVYQMMSMILPLVTSPILARTLGAEGLGIYSYVFTIVGYFVLAANLGMYKYGIRSIAAVRDNKEELSKTFWEIWKLHTVVTFFVGIIYILCLLNFFEYKTYFAVMLMTYVGSVININWLFFGLEEFKKVTIRDMIIKLITFVMIVFFIRSKESLFLYFVINAVGTLISNLIYWFMYKKYVYRKSIHFSDSIKHLKGMLLLFIPVLLESLYYGIDKIMLGIMKTKSEVGYYENADKALIARTMIYSITTVLMPRMANLLAKKDYNEFNRIMKQATAITIILASAFAFGTASVAREFAIVFWGKDFVKSVNLIIIMAMAMPAVVLAREVREQYLIPAGKDKEYIFSATAGTIANIVVNTILIPEFGAMGAAIATLLSEYIVLIVQLIAVRKELNMLSYIHGNEIYFLFGMIMFIVVRYVGDILGIHIYSLIIEVIVGMIIYVMLCSVYWILSKQYDYFDLIKSVIRSQW